VNRTMVQRAIELLGACEGELVLDLFCGLGNFTLPLAKAAAGATVIGVESDERLVAAATENAARNGIGNASFRRADLYDESAVKDLWSALKPQRLLLDPPRSGAIEVLKLMPEKNSPARIVYVSCNPATLARDAEYLVNARGYRLEAAGVLDMFPHTSHVESIAVFEKSGRKK
jgi:23S rRNA (uracil1939-C5)-methyltransferase